MFKVLKIFNDATRRLDRFLGVEDNRRDYRKEYSSTSIKLSTNDLPSEEAEKLRYIFREFYFKEGFMYMFGEAEIYVPLIIKLLEKENRELADSLRKMYSEKVLDTDGYRKNGYVPFDSMDFSREDVEFLEKIRILIREKYLDSGGKTS